MEELAHDTCSIVYFCSSVHDEIHQLYHRGGPPQTPSAASAQLDCVYRNVRALLDEDQGDFDQVFLCSRADKCMDRLENVANSTPTIVLLELHNTSSEVHDPANGSFSFLRALAADIHGARFQKHVMPFVLMTSDGQTHPDAELDQAVTTDCLKCGALDVLRSPLRHDDINRMIGHFKEKNRPPAHLLGAPMAQNLVDSIHDVSKPPRMAIYRPDEDLSAERRAAVESAVHRWHFPAQDFNMDELTYAALYMLEHVLQSPELNAYALKRQQLVAFLLATRRQYKHEREVHYHNWRHAVDVSQCVFCFLLELRLCPRMGSDARRTTEPTALERILTPLDGLILLVSAIGHDVGHPGVNNAFLVACNHPLAQTYNDKSVLENYHGAAYQQLLRRHWPALNQIACFRATMISTILATDMQRHFDYMSQLAELKGKVEDGRANADEWNDKDRENTKELLMALLIKAADISNVARPFDIAAKWARILMYEFARQGELESELQIPTCLFGGPPNTEDMLAAAQSQKGFLSLFGFPLFQGIAEVMPSLSSAVRELENNQSLWNQRIDEEKQRREPDNAMERPHFSSVSKDDVDEAQLEHHRSEPSAVPLDAIQSPSTPVKRVATDHSDTPLSKHGAQESKQQLTSGITFNEDKRSSAPVLLPPSLAYSAGGASRRSSKDIALDQLQQLNAFAQQNVGSGSRRGSADAGWQIHQNYPNSRRGSKDESLTTIFVSSGASQNRRSSPSAPGKRLSPGKSTVKKHSAPIGQRLGASRTLAPSVEPSTAEVEASNMTQYSPAILPSSTAAEEDGQTTPLAALGTIPSTEDPFLLPGTWPNDLDGAHRASIQGDSAELLPSTPPPPPKLGLTKSESDATSRAETEKEDLTLPTGEPRLQQSRSRSRLRGLKFWKKRRDMSGVERDFPPSPSP